MPQNVFQFSEEYGLTLWIARLYSQAVLPTCHLGDCSMMWSQERDEASFAGGSPFRTMPSQNVKMGNMHFKHYALLHTARQVKELRLSNYAKRDYNQKWPYDDPQGALKCFSQQV
jgi:hypothetical protein